MLYYSPDSPCRNQDCSFDLSIRTPPLPSEDESEDLDGPAPKKRKGYIATERFLDPATGGAAEDDAPPPPEKPPNKELHKSKTGIVCSKPRCPHVVGYYEQQNGRVLWYGRCANCRERSRNFVNGRSAERLAGGMCGHCGLFPPMKGSGTCQNCLNVKKAGKDELFASGKCYSGCGNPREEDSQYCQRCRERATKDIKAHRETSQGQATEQRGQKRRSEKIRKDDGRQLDKSLRCAVNRILAGADRDHHRDLLESKTGLTVSTLRTHFLTKARTDFGDDGITLEKDYGNGKGLELQVDHNIPRWTYVKNFDDPDEVRRCWDPSNTRLAPGSENGSKGAKILWEHVKMVHPECYPKAWKGRCPVSETNPWIREEDYEAWLAELERATAGAGPSGV